MSQTAAAILTHAPSPQPTFIHTTVTVNTNLQPGELLIRVIATGLCHTDIYCASVPSGTPGFNYPIILGHEGAGYVEAVGPNVTVASKGDPVLLSYDFCGQCTLCDTGRPTYCERFNELNIAGSLGTYSGESQEIHGKFFGQSSFSSLTVVNESSIVNVKSLDLSRDDLKLLAPLGCGLQTGAGAVINSGAGSSDILLVIGLGGVGLSAVMAGKIAGIKEIIAVDRVESRLHIANEVGATKTLNTTGIPNSDLVSAIRKTVNDDRISLAIDTTGVSFLINTAISALGKRGKYIQIGIPPIMENLTVPWMDLWGSLKTIEMNIEGGAVAKEFVPKMIGWWREGKFPVETMVEWFKAEDVGDAVKGMESGKVIKPVLLW